MLTLTALSLFTLTMPAAPGTKETRTFRVEVDDKPAGQFVLQYENQEDRQRYSVSCNTTVKQLIFKYQYDLVIMEEWQRGQLVQLQSQSNDDGTKTKLQVDGSGLISINGVKKQMPTVAMTLACCRLPSYETELKKYQALDVDSGQVVPVEVKATHRVKAKVGDKTIDGLSYLISGSNQHADVWFDSDGKLIGSIRKEDGHIVHLILVSIQR